MENLWPVDLGAKSPTPNEQILAILHEQARGLGERTNGQVMGEIRERNTPPLALSASLFIFPYGGPNKSYELLAVRSPNSGFPLVLEAAHLSEADRIMKVNNVRELTGALRKIFNRKSTTDVVRLLAAEAAPRASSEAEDKFSAHGVITRHTTAESRAIAIGAGIRTDDGGIAQVSFFGVSGFLKADALRALTLKPGSRGAAVETLDGKRYVASLQFHGAVKMTLSEDEVTSVRMQAEKSLAALG